MEKKRQPAKKSRPATKPRVQNERLQGWNGIASFLAQPVAVAQPWVRSGMPGTREGRSVCLAGAVESIPRPRSWAGCTCSHRDRRHGSVCRSETCSRVRPSSQAGETRSEAMKEQSFSSLLEGKKPFAPRAAKTGVTQTAQQPNHSHVLWLQSFRHVERDLELGISSFSQPIS